MRTLPAGRFHGTRRDVVHHAGLTLAASDYRPGHRLPRHAHENAFFSLLLRGHFTERLERRSRTCVPTSLVFYPAHEPHEEAFGDRGGSAFNIELGDEWTARMGEYGTAWEAGSEEMRGARVNWLATRLYAWFQDAGPEVAGEELVWEMVSEVARRQPSCRETRAPAWLSRVLERLREDFRSTVRVGDLADEAGVHPVYLARVFRRFQGCTVGTYVLRLRIEHACAALAGGAAPLTDIALENGFADQAHFTRRFKALTGVPPGVYRRIVAG